MQTYDYQGDCVEIDMFNPEVRKYIWEICKKNYRDLGVDGFWLDNTEPDLGAYDFEHYRYCDGPALAVSNLYPQLFSRAFYDEMKAMDRGPVVNLLHCGWAGSQKYGNVIWSDDIPSTFEAFSDQLQCGLNMGLAGISWRLNSTGEMFQGDRTVSVDAPIEYMPVFERQLWMKTGAFRAFWLLESAGLLSAEVWIRSSSVLVRGRLSAANAGGKRGFQQCGKQRICHACIFFQNSFCCTASPLTKDPVISAFPWRVPKWSSSSLIAFRCVVNDSIFAVAEDAANIRNLIQSAP